MDFTPDLACAQRLDAQDLLAPFRNRFVIDDPELIYLDGNSLGRLLKTTQQRLHEVIDHEWGQQLIRGWNLSWMASSERVGGKLAQLLGARAEEVVVADSTSINLFKLAHAALCARPERHKIVTDDLNFPSDHYVLQGLARMSGRPLEIQVCRSPDGVHGPLEALAEAIDSDTALVTLSHTTFKTSYTYDMAQVTALAERAGALILWDVSHSVGSMPLALNACNAPLAVGCTYKHLNGGPGAPAFLYVRRDLQSQLDNPIPGWMGHQNVFSFELGYTADLGIRRFLTGTPFVLSLAAIEPAVELFLEAGIERVREKAVRQSEFFIHLWKAWLETEGFALNAPKDPARRGAHLSLGHAQGLSIDQALIHDMKVIPDFRPPDNIRFGFTPLYTTFQEVYEGARRLREVMAQKLHEKYTEAPLVT